MLTSKRFSLLALAFGAWLGASGCMFAHDSDCQDNSECFSGHVCSAGACVAAGDPSLSGAGSPGGDGTATSYRSQLDDPQQELACFGKQGVGWSSPSHWPATCIADELPSVVQAAPELGEGPSKTFRFEAGLLVSFDGHDCIPCAPDPPNTSADYTVSICAQTYHCGVDCSVSIASTSIPPTGKPDPSWEGSASCPTYTSYYLGASDAVPTCTPHCSGKSCGDNGCGGSCGSCTAGATCVAGSCSSPSSGGGASACSNCLSSCSGLPGCCTGSGCICESAC